MSPWRPPAVIMALEAGILLICACSSSSPGRPRVDGALPAVANPRTATFVMIQGDRFAHNAEAKLGSSPLGKLTWVNAQMLTGELPANMQPGRYDLTVVNPGVGQATLPGAITVAGAGPNATAPPVAASPTPQPTRTASAHATAPPSPSPSPSPSPTPEPRTAAPTQRATEAPTQRATEAPTQRATQPPTQTAPPARTATSSPRGQIFLNLTGTWLILDTVTYGPGTGNTYPFQVVIQQESNRIIGAGSGLRLSGVIEDLQVHVNYVQENGATGTFEWTLDPSGNAFAGSFTNSTGNGGNSVGQRAGGALGTLFQALFQNPPQDDEGKGRGKR